MCPDCKEAGISSCPGTALPPLEAALAQATLKSVDATAAATDSCPDPEMDPDLALDSNCTSPASAGPALGIREPGPPSAEMCGAEGGVRRCLGDISAGVVEGRALIPIQSPDAMPST